MGLYFLVGGIGEAWARRRWGELARAVSGQNDDLFHHRRLWNSEAHWVRQERP